MLRRQDETGPVPECRSDPRSQGPKGAGAVLERRNDPRVRPQQVTQLAEAPAVDHPSY